MKGAEIMKNKKMKTAFKIILSVFAAVAIFIIALLLLVLHKWDDVPQEYETDNPFISELGETTVSAHRSGAGIFPENTMMAFEGCIANDTFNTDIFEFDIHITKDEQLILLHDDTLDRTTNSRKVFGVENARPEDYTYEELRQLNFGEGFVTDDGQTPYKGIEGDAVPENLKASRLQDVLSFLEENGGFRYIIEIKNGDALGRKATDILYEILKEKGLLDKAIVGTFNGEITKYINDTYPDMVRSSGIVEVVIVYLAALLDIELPEEFFSFVALQVPYDTPILDLCTPRFVNYAHKNNVAVQYWTVNDPDIISFLESIGTDSITTDIPDIVYSILNES